MKTPVFTGTCFYEVKVTDELGTEVAFVTVNGYVVHDNGRGET